MTSSFTVNRFDYALTFYNDGRFGTTTVRSDIYKQTLDFAGDWKVADGLVVFKLDKWPDGQMYMADPDVQTAWRQWHEARCREVAAMIVGAASDGE